jgi:hypothetical protein
MAQFCWRRSIPPDFDKSGGMEQVVHHPMNFHRSQNRVDIADLINTWEYRFP